MSALSNNQATGAGTVPAPWWVRTLRTVGMDRAVTFTVLARGWGSIAGLMTVFLIAHFLTAAEQGYYYTFGSLVALQIIFELGFSFVILQAASHERAHLTITDDGRVEGGAVPHARLASVLQKSLRWYSVAAVLMFCSLIPAGIHFFQSTPHAGTAVAWRLPWYLVVLAASLAFQIDPLFSFLEGCGYVPLVARTRLWQALLGSALAWSALLTHHGLFAPAMSITGQVIMGLVFLSTHRRLLMGLIRHPVGDDRIKWRAEVWPFQWRIAVSWISGYFIFQLFVPVLFHYSNPVSAGQMGMSLGIVSLLMSISMSWLTTKAAPFAAMVARKEYSALDHAFFRVLAQSTAVSIACAAIAVALVAGLNAVHSKLANRMLSPKLLAMFLAAMVLNHIIFGEAIYMRSHKQEKFLIQSVVGALLIGTSTYVLGRRYGATGIVSGYFGLSILSFIAATMTFFYYRRLWHSEKPGIEKDGDMMVSTK